LGLTKKEYACYLHVNARTLDRNLKEKFTLDIDKTEKILLLWELMKRGIDVFGSEEKFSIWIREFNTALQKKPIDMFSTITGINLVNNLLTRIEYGVFS
jgi:putative toxin-antitoxin system antitoxin component (TIGR02293 family)